MCKKIIDKCCKIWVCAARAAAAQCTTFQYQFINASQNASWWFLEPKKWDISGKKKTAQDAALWTSETQIIPGLDPGLAALGQNKNYTSLVSGGNQHQGTGTRDSRNKHQHGLTCSYSCAWDNMIHNA